MKNTLETRLGLFFALALITAVIILEMLGGAAFLKKGYRVHGLFKNVQELKVGDRVKLAGVQVGQVEKIQITNDQVNVTMKLDRNAEGAFVLPHIRFDRALDFLIGDRMR